MGIEVPTQAGCAYSEDFTAGPVLSGRVLQEEQQKCHRRATSLFYLLPAFPSSFSPWHVISILPDTWGTELFYDSISSPAPKHP